MTEMLDPYRNPADVPADLDPEFETSDEDLAEIMEADEEVRRMQRAANPHIPDEPVL